MKTWSKLISMVALALPACGEPAPETFAEPRVYGRLPALAASLDECLELQARDGVLNCDERIRFCPDGKASVMFSDIVLGGAYELRGDEVVLQVEPNPEIPDTATLTIETGDRLRLSFDPQGRPLERRPGEDAGCP